MRNIGRTLEDSHAVARMLLLAALLILSGRAGALDRGLSGLWYNPAQPGHGFEITVISSTSASVAWYTYSPFGGPIWVAGLLDEISPGVLAGDVSYHDGMVFGQFNPANARTFRWGTLRLSFANCDEATVEYNGTLTYQTGEGFGSGTLPLRKLAGIHQLPCATAASAASLAGAYDGWVYSNARREWVAAHALVEGNGTATFMIPGDVAYFGTYTVSGSSVAFTLTGQTVAGRLFPNGSATTTATGTGTARATDYISGTYSIPGDSGTFTFQYLGLSTRPTSVASIAGTYLDTASGSSLRATISSNGSVTGSDGSGCTFSGSMAALGSGINAFSATLNATGCGPGNGAYTGKVVVADLILFGDSRALAIAFRGPTNSVTAYMRKN